MTKKTEGAVDWGGCRPPAQASYCELITVQIERLEELKQEILQRAMLLGATALEDRVKPDTVDMGSLNTILVRLEELGDDMKHIADQMERFV